MPGAGIHVPLIEGSFIPVANRRNDYLIDRAAQNAKKTFSGVLGVGVQDAAIQESMERSRTAPGSISSPRTTASSRRAAC